jgi:poly(3-hydroxybutyrate) depolymerase
MSSIDLAPRGQGPRPTHRLGALLGPGALGVLLLLDAGCGPGVSAGPSTGVGLPTPGSGGAGSGSIGSPDPGGGTGGTPGAPGTGGAAPASSGGTGVGSGGAATPQAGTGGAGKAPTGGGFGIGGRSGSGGGSFTGFPGTGFPGFGSGGTGPGTGTGAGGGPITGASGGASPGSPSVDGPAPTMLPTPKGTCPTIATGSLTFAGQAVQVWAGTPSATTRGPLVIYWYATGSSPSEVQWGLGQAAVSEITAAGGMVAAQVKTTATGTNTGDAVWYTGDFDIADEVVACAIQQLHIDTRRIHAAGFSAGGLQTAWMSYARSGYLASVATYSGGTSGFGRLAVEDASNVPSAMVIHGASGSDVVILDFATASANYEADIKSRGGFAIDCNHGGGHMIPTPAVPSVWRFMKDHPFKVSPEPYGASGIPSTFPTYCKIP